MRQQQIASLTQILISIDSKYNELNQQNLNQKNFQFSIIKINFQFVGLQFLSMSDSEDFETQDLQCQIHPSDEYRPLSVRKYLQNPKQLMEKILFTSFKVDPFFPVQFLPLPQMMKPDTAQKEQNNMSLIQQSAFQHQKLKKDIFGLLSGFKPSNKKTLPSITEYYSYKEPVYQKYKPDDKSKCLATFLLDSKTILKQQFRKSSSVFKHLKSHQPLISHRNKIEFSSNFQSGNLFRVYQVQYNQFDLILQNDINTKGNNQWFFFFVRNVPKGFTLKFNIVNLTKKHSLFDNGMKPYIFSMIRHQKRKVGWVRQGSKVHYQQNDKFMRYNEKPYFCLSFQYKFHFQGDIVYFSHSIPYRVSQLTNFLCTHIKDPRNSRLIKLKDLNRTLGNQQIDIIQISDEQPRENKKVVWIIARQHPGQVTSSFMMEGIINFLLSHNEKAKQILRKFVFKLVPMINVDGVIHGNSRSELNGSDPNRKWGSPHKIRNPIIWALKKAIQKDKGRIQMFLDLHSHSRKLGTFFYGNSLRQNKIATRKYPWMVCQNDERFSYTESRFSQCNLRSARHVLFQSLQIPLIYTVESSFYGYQKNDHRIIQYLPKDYREMGEKLIEIFGLYTSVSHNKMINTLNNEEEIITIEQMEKPDQEEDKLSIGSDSDPGQDQFQQKQLKKLLPNFYGSSKINQSKKKKKKKKQVPKVIEKQEVQPIVVPKVKKNLKQSHYRIYFSGKNSRVDKPLIKDRQIQTHDVSVQASISQFSVLKGSTNMSATTYIQKKSSLCIWGQKVEQQVSAFGNVVGLQVDMMKVFAQNKDECRKNIARKSFKLSSRPNSILQVKQNNFLNRGDCHTLPLRSLSRR